MPRFRFEVYGDLAHGSKSVHLSSRVAISFVPPLECGDVRLNLDISLPVRATIYNDVNSSHLCFHSRVLLIASSSTRLTSSCKLPSPSFLSTIHRSLSRTLSLMVGSHTHMCQQTIFKLSIPSHSFFFHFHVSSLVVISFHSIFPWFLSILRSGEMVVPALVVWMMRCPFSLEKIIRVSISKKLL
ncbi:uncharacterized protein EI90DRAFT_3110097, partial [Cantharellus anzutake]|uniref:uncharacterized protein n=1 Tax=Cantharellus anzutake TaxID=1750568 RepID=UPI0019033412